MTTVIVDYTKMTTGLKKDIATLKSLGIITGLDIRNNQLILTPINEQAIISIGVMVGRHKETNYMYDYINK